MNFRRKHALIIAILTTIPVLATAGPIAGEERSPEYDAPSYTSDDLKQVKEGAMDLTPLWMRDSRETEALSSSRGGIQPDVAKSKVRANLGRFREEIRLLHTVTADTLESVHVDDRPIVTEQKMKELADLMERFNKHVTSLSEDIKDRYPGVILTAIKDFKTQVQSIESFLRGSVE